ncbi:MAG: hypothetical protein FWE42_05810, partial [Defluviitaleaceae bacterium]|nr:hypothetical protein [Defluviitaleaceae bacterium]
MKTKIKKALKTLVLSLLILGMLAPTAVLAAPFYDEGARWIMPVIEPLDIDLSRHPELADIAGRHSAASLFEGLEGLSPEEMMEALAALTGEEQAVAAESLYMHVNELSELDPDVLEEVIRAQLEYWAQESGERGMVGIGPLLGSGVDFSQTTEADRNMIFRHLDIAYAAQEVTAELLALMEADGFTLTDSIELVRIMSSGLFSYVQAQEVLAMIPLSRQRIAELTRFEHFAARFDIVDYVNARRLVNRPFVSTNGFEGTAGVAIGGIDVFMASE